jgi:hypothetical protein
MPKTKTSQAAESKPYRLRRSPVHGTGVFATRVIKKGAGVIEYVGERISHAEADRRHSKKDIDDGHTFLFTVNSKVVIDAGVDGNEARFINHSCEPNCEVINDKGRLFVETLRTIKPGEELNYDYNIGRTPEDPPNADEIFACRCGSKTCRGTMLSPKRKSKAKKTVKKNGAKRALAKKGKAPTKSKAGLKSKAGAKTKAGLKSKAGAKTKRR